MFVYKYRGGNDEIFERDLNALEKNYFWSSKFEDLNDPQENLIITDKFINQSGLLGRFLGKRSSEALSKVQESLKNILSHNNRIGIYSLSKSSIDELLWAHYANSHKGFCIEYDLDLLMNSYVYENKYSFPVIYNENPSELSLKDISSASKNNDLIQKIFGSKSKKWEYEEEYRIITDDFGVHSYDFQAVKAIYFGLRMLDSQKAEIINRLKGRNIKFYQINQVDKKYKFEAVLVKDIDYSELTYLNQIPIEISNSKPINYEIFEKHYYKISKKADIKVEIESIILEDQISWLANVFPEHLFQNAERIYIFYYLKNQNKDGIAWATSHILYGEMEISINDYILKV